MNLATTLACANNNIANNSNNGERDTQLRARVEVFSLLLCLCTPSTLRTAAIKSRRLSPPPSLLVLVLVLRQFAKYGGEYGGAGHACDSECLIVDELRQLCTPVPFDVEVHTAPACDE